MLISDADLPLGTRHDTEFALALVLVGAAVRESMHAGRPVPLPNSGTCCASASIQVVVGDVRLTMAVKVKVVVRIPRSEDPRLAQAYPAARLPQLLGKLTAATHQGGMVATFTCTGLPGLVEYFSMKPVYMTMPPSLNVSNQGLSQFLSHLA